MASNSLPASHHFSRKKTVNQVCFQTLYEHLVVFVWGHPGGGQRFPVGSNLYGLTSMMHTLRTFLDMEVRTRNFLSAFLSSKSPLGSIVF